MAHVTGAPTTLTLGGKDYTLFPLTDIDIEEVNNFIRARIMRFAHESLSGITDQKIREEVLGAALKQARNVDFGFGQGIDELHNLDGVCHVIWQGLRRAHPDLSQKEVKALLSDPETMMYATTVWHELNTVPKPAGDARPESPKASASRSTRSRSTRPSPDSTSGRSTRSPG